MSLNIHLVYAEGFSFHTAGQVMSKKTEQIERKNEKKKSPDEHRTMLVI